MLCKCGKHVVCIVVLHELHGDIDFDDMIDADVVLLALV